MSDISGWHIPTTLAAANTIMRLFKTRHPRWRKTRTVFALIGMSDGDGGLVWILTLQERVCAAKHGYTRVEAKALNALLCSAGKFAVLYPRAQKGILAGAWIETVEHVPTLVFPDGRKENIYLGPG